MDVHRGRFVPYPSAVINALAFSHSTGEELFEHKQEDLRLAVGRSNGDIEIWNPAKGAWVQETVFHGGKDRSVEGLAWTQEPPEVDSKGKKIPGALRLFSIGYSSTVTEWNLGTGLPLRNSTGNYSEVWCLAAQPRLINNAQSTDEKTNIAREKEWQGQKLAVGCADGTLVLLSTQDNDLQFYTLLTRQTSKRARILSLAWKDRNIVVAGFANSSIGIYDSRNSTCIRTITLGAGPAGGPKDILVWAVKCLPNGDVVSGDSTGEVRFFDGKQYSQYQRLAGHEADVLDLAISPDGQTIWTAGMDRKTAVYTRATPGASKRGAWARSLVKTFHEHDVKAMATFEFGNKKLSCIASGGIDTNLVIIPMRGFWTEHHRTISGLPQLPPLVSAPRARIVMSWWERELSIWRVNKRDADGKAYTLLVRLALQGEENINSAAISQDGSVIAVATSASVRLFTLKVTNAGDEAPTVRFRKVSSETLNFGSRLVQFSPDGTWLGLVTHANDIKVARIQYQNEKPFIQIQPHLTNLKRSRGKDSKSTRKLDTYSKTITRLQFSPDSRMLAASDLSGLVHSWIQSSPADQPTNGANPTPSSSSDSSSDSDSSSSSTPSPSTHSLWRPNPAAPTLPRLPSAALLLTFRPCAPSHLVALTSAHQLYEFDLSTGCLTAWSARNPSWRLPARFGALLDRALGCVWRGGRCWVYGRGWVALLDLGADLPREEGGDGAGAGRRKRRRGEAWSGAGDGKALEGGRLSAEVGTLAGYRVERVLEERVLERGGEEDEEEERGWDDMEVDGRDGEDEDEQRSKKRPAEDDGKKKWWCSFKYRPILGMVPLEDSEQQAKDNDVVEVVLIERPVWDLDLPERFTSSYER